MANTDSIALQKVHNDLRQEITIKDQENKENLSKTIKSFNKSVDSAGLNDDKIIKMIKEINQSDGEYKKRIESLTKDYISEQQLNGKISKEESKKIGSLLTKMNDTNEVRKELRLNEERKESQDNPLNAFKHSFEEFKRSGSASDSIKQLGVSLKESINLKNISKSILHGAGIGLDMPALNILATTIEDNTEARNEDIEKTNNFIKDIEESPKKDDSVKPASGDSDDSVINKYKETLRDEKLINDSIMMLLENIHIDHGALLEKLHEESEYTNLYFEELLETQREALFIMKDSRDDVSPASSDNILDAPLLNGKNNSDKNDSDILDIPGLDMMNNKDNKRRKTRGKSFGGKLAKAGASFGKTALKAIPVAGAIVTAGFAISAGMEGFQKASDTFELKAGQEATTSEKVASSLGEIAEELSFGFLSAKDIAKSIDKSSEWFKDISNIDVITNALTGTSQSSSDIAEELDDKGIIDKSIIGDSRINDWEAIETMKPEDILSLKNYDDWSENDLKRFDSAIAKAMNKNSVIVPRVDTEPIQASAQKEKVMPSEINQKSQKIEVIQPEQKAPIVNVQVPRNNNQSRKIDKYGDDSDLLTTLKMRGIDNL